jgi:pimeloyl-ACP methyl ester carboxylesterase
MAKRPIPAEVMGSWLVGLRSERRIRKDVARYVRTSDLHGLEAAAVDLAHFDRPTLVLWSTEDRVMPPEHGRRLAEIIPDSQLVEIDDAYTLMALDRPEAVAERISAFVARVHARS